MKLNNRNKSLTKSMTKVNSKDISNLRKNPEISEEFIEKLVNLENDNRRLKF